MPFLEVSDLRKTFRDRKRTVEAVKGISFSIGEGEMVGLLGPNGAGKTTTIKCILNLVNPDSGRITVGGIDRMANPREAAAKMSGVLEGSRNTYWRLTAWENMVFFAGIHGVSEKSGRDYFEYLMEVLQFKDKKNVEVRQLSSGYKQKVAVACALAKRTPLVFLDEPTLGLDVESSYELREALKRIQKEERRTIVMSSHDMRVIQDLCERVIIIAQGRIVADDRVQDLISLFSTRKYKVVVRDDRSPDSSSKIAGAVSQAFSAATVNANLDEIEILVRLDDAGQMYHLVDVLRSSGALIETITQEEVDLEKAFLEIVRRENAACG